MRRRWWIGLRRGAVIAVVAVALGACTTGSSTDGPPAAVNPPVLGDLSSKPTVAVPEQILATLSVADLVVGEGRPAQLGDIVTVHIVTVATSTGAEIDSTWELAAPRRVPLVEGGAVQGFLDGVVGMQVGGRRSLVVPPALAYGDSGAPPAVAPGETLVFVIDVLAIDTPRG